MPRHAASVWADVKLNEIERGLSIGGGVVYQSPLHNGYTTTGAAPNLTGLSRYVVIPETVELDAGDVLFFHSRLLHAAGDNRTNETKFSLVATYHAAANRPRKGTRSASLPDIPL